MTDSSLSLPKGNLTNLVSAAIDLGACADNCARLRKAAGRRKLFAVVKANAYGHGMERVAGAIAGSVDGYCVFNINDGTRMGALKLGKPVLLLGGVQSDGEAEAAADLGLWVAVGSARSLGNATAHAGRLQRVLVKVQTGMHRLGLPASEVAGAVESLRKAGCKDVALMTHYSDADVEGGTASQDRAMDELVRSSGLPYSKSNSAATLSLPESGEEFVRCGIAVYGCTPFAHDSKSAESLGLRPAMALASSVIAVQDVKKGGTVGYGSRWRAESDTKVAVVACGYAHGYPRSAPDGTPVWISGRERPLAGRVSMEMLTVECPEGDVAVGDAAQLWGDRIPADLVANLSGTIGYELVAGLPEAVPRRHSPQP